MSFLDNLFKPGVAQALATTGAPVDVSSADPPNVNDVLQRGADATHAIWGPSPGSASAGALTSVLTAAPTLDAVAGHDYFCQAVCDVTLPDPRSTPGQLLIIRFGNFGENVIRIPPPGEEIDFFMVDWQLQTRLDPILPLPLGVYECRAVYDPDDYPVGLWMISRSPASMTRRAIDVDFCMPGELPAGYEKVDIGALSERWFLNATGDTPTLIPQDFAGSYSPGQTLLVPFDGDWPGLYRVNQNDAPDTWQLELLEQLPQSQNHLHGNSETQYRIRYGDNWGGRVFTSNVAGNSVLPTGLHLERAPLEPWPYAGDLQGDGFVAAGYDDDTLLIGKVNLLSVSLDHTFNLSYPVATDIVVGERFAIKTSAWTGTPRAITVNVTDSASIEGTDGIVGTPSVTVVMQLGTYIEWQFMPDEVWRVVAYIEGSAGA
jgi:hypothetical protein